MNYTVKMLIYEKIKDCKFNDINAIFLKPVKPDFKNAKL